MLTGNYADFARAFGGHGIEVSKIEELEPALKEAQDLNKKGITVIIDVKTVMESKRGYRT